jgi:ABC-type lipoprotein release transport system permease subunit
MACAYLLSQLLAGLNPTDPVTYVVVIAGLGGVCLLATWLPPRRMAAMEPGRTLRDS